MIPETGERWKVDGRRMAMVAEGIETCRSAHHLGVQHDVEMPITGEVHRVLFEGKPPADAVADLMSRSLKEEIWS